MKTELYKFENNRLEQIDTNQDPNLKQGQLIRWGGNMANMPETYAVISKSKNNLGVYYNVINIENLKKFKKPAYIIDGSYKILNKSLSSTELKELILQSNEKEKKEKIEEERLKEIRNKKIQEGKILFEKHIPSAAKALIVANRIKNCSNVQTDYFGHSEEQKVVLGYSMHEKDLFSEMRKHAKKLEETKHLQHKHKYIPRVVICQDIQPNGYKYRKGQYSHWHQELEEDQEGNRIFFYTEKEAKEYIKNHKPEPINFEEKLINFGWEIEKECLEHREKWSGGNGYFLKDGYSNSTGWEIRKELINNNNLEEYYISLAEKCIFN